LVVCLERGADLHMAQLMPLPLTVSCFSKIQIGFILPGTGSRDKGPLNGCVCVCILHCCCVHICCNPDDTETIARTFLRVSPARRSAMCTRARVGSAQTYHPSAEQFQEPISYIDSVHENARTVGICRILPPPEEWKVCVAVAFACRVLCVVILICFTINLTAFIHFALSVCHHAPSVSWSHSQIVTLVSLSHSELITRPKSSPHCMMI